jgi:hypothetical protein
MGLSGWFMGGHVVFMGILWGLCKVYGLFMGVYVNFMGGSWGLYCLYGCLMEFM